MAILIEGMEMPFTCLTCDFHKCAGGVGDFCSLTKRRQFRFKNRPKDCPLIEVPEPHGRLGDLDELAKQIEHDRYHHTHTDGLAVRHHIVEYGHFLNAISEAPTIIPASEEG